MMLTRLKVENFKALRDLEATLGPLTVLVGPNGCGKSSVLGAVTLMRDLFMERAKASIPPGIISRTDALAEATRSIQLKLSCETASGSLSARATITPDADHPDEADPEFSLWAQLGADIYERDRSNEHKPPKWVTECFGHIEQYRLDATVMAQPAYSEQARPSLGSNGSNLAAVLDALQGERRELFETVEHELCQFIPGLRRVRLHRVSMPVVREVLVGDQYQRIRDATVGHQVVFDYDFANGVRADQSSEGTLLLLGLLTIIGVGSGGPTTVMLDDLDRALHPRAQRQLIEHLHQLLDQRPNLQIIATSHSPYLVEHLAYEEVLAMTQANDDGRSLIAPLADHPESDRWREEMTAGEFWSTMGEDWVAQRRVAGE